MPKVDFRGSTGALVFASAAALTLGRLTVPVYEIYKVGATPTWAEGLDLLVEHVTGLVNPIEIDIAAQTLSVFRSGYEIGRAIGPPLYERDGRILKRKYFDQTQAFFDKHGNKALVIGRFVPFVRTYITVVAGATRMDRRKFIECAEDLEMELGHSRKVQQAPRCVAVRLDEHLGVAARAEGVADGFQLAAELNPTDSTADAALSQAATPDAQMP